MLQRIVALLALLAASPSYAYTIWWNRVTQYEDGAELSVSDTVSYRVEWADGEDFSTIVGSRVLTAASANVADHAGVLRCYRVIAYFAHAPEVEPSDPSNVWCKDMRPVVQPPVRRKLRAVTGLSGN